MTDEKDPAEPESTAETQAEAPVSSEDQVPESPKVEPGVAEAERSRRPLLIWLALVMALISLLMAVWQYSASPLLPDGAAENEAVGRVNETLSSLDQRLADLEAQMGGVLAAADQTSGTTEALAQRLDALEQQLAQALADLAAAPTEPSPALPEIEMRLESLEQTLDSRQLALQDSEQVLRQASEEADVRLRLLEIVSLLSWAQQRYELAGDVMAARDAYRRADALLRGLDDPRLGQARRQLRRELEALEAVDPPDLTAAAARIAQAAEQVNQWPFRQRLVDAHNDDKAPDGEDWRSAAQASLRQLVRVRPRDEIDLDAATAAMVREQARLRMVTAELALARGDLRLLAQQLEQIDGLIDRWFDGEAPILGRWRETAEDLRSLGDMPSAIELGDALLALRGQLERP